MKNQFGASEHHNNGTLPGTLVTPVTPVTLVTLVTLVTPGTLVIRLS